MRRHIHLVIIDPQNDFCDLPSSYLTTNPTTDRPTAPALPVPGAHGDMLRLARLVLEGARGLTDVTITLDSHHRVDVAHPTFWRRADGSDVAPFTTITAREVRAGDYVPRSPAAAPRTLEYLDALEANGRYTLMIWPVHCEIGTWGHNVHPDVHCACASWQEAHQKPVRFVSKGENPWTEHYSAVLAEVPDPLDPHTLLNTTLLNHLDRADLILIAGEASSHCVRATTEHLVAHLPSGRPDRITLLTDCMSPVTGFAAEHEAFLDDMRRRGSTLTTAAEILPLLLDNTSPTPMEAR